MQSVANHGNAIYRPEFIPNSHFFRMQLLFHNHSGFILFFLTSAEENFVGKKPHWKPVTLASIQHIYGVVNGQTTLISAWVEFYVDKNANSNVNYLFKNHEDGLFYCWECHEVGKFANSCDIYRTDPICKAYKFLIIS